jgi:preprotein translocase, YajC subunit
MLTNFNWLLEVVPEVAEVVELVPEAVPQMGFLEMIPQLAMIGITFVALYFLMIRPQRKKDKAVKDMLAAIKVGDRVCTIGGIYGTILTLKEDTITIAVGAAKTQMVMARWAIRSVENVALENEAEPQV